MTSPSPGQALELYLAGASIPQIADRLRCDIAAVQEVIEAAIGARVDTGGLDPSVTELARLDALLTVQWSRARQGDSFATDRVMKILERRAAVLADPGSGIVAARVRAELAALGEPMTPSVATLAAQAMRLADGMDHTRNPASIPRLNKELRSTMAEARLAAQAQETDEVGEILDDDGGSGLGRRAGTSGPHHAVAHLRPVPSGAVTG